MQSDHWLALDRRHAWHPFTQHHTAPEPLAVTGAKGAWLELADGRRLIDGISSWWACLHGHGLPAFVEVMRAQAELLDHVLYAGCAHQPAAQLAAELARLTGLGRAFFSDDGSTAVEVALKAAFQAQRRRGEGKRHIYLALEDGYHGDTFGAMAVGDPEPFFKEFASLLFEVRRVAPSVDALEAVMHEVGDECVALILEPGVQGAGGMRPVAPEFLRGARRLCDAHGVYLIADEVFVGFGRSGHLFASDAASVVPDFMCLAKGLTNGMFPLAVTMARDEIYELFLSDDPARCLFHGHTFTANPIGCAIALLSCRLTEENKVPDRFEEIGARILSHLDAELPVHLVPRRVGGVVAVDLPAADAGYLSSLRDRLRSAIEQTHVLLRPLGHVLYTIPPVCVTDAECDQIAEAMIKVSQAAYLS